jgi:hypothetical protein
MTMFLCRPWSGILQDGPWPPGQQETGTDGIAPIRRLITHRNTILRLITYHKTIRQLITYQNMGKY